MRLTANQRAILRRAACEGINAIDGTVALLRQLNPAAFHTAESAAQRVFVHAPKADIPLARVIRKYY